MSRKLEQRHRNDLFINETLTVQKNVIYHALLDVEKVKIYTMFSIWGTVYFNTERFGTISYVDSVEKLYSLEF